MNCNFPGPRPFERRETSVLGLGLVSTPPRRSFTSPLSARFQPSSLHPFRCITVFSSFSWRVHRHHALLTVARSLLTESHSFCTPVVHFEHWEEILRSSQLLKAPRRKILNRRNANRNIETRQDLAENKIHEIHNEAFGYSGRNWHGYTIVIITMRGEA